MRLNQNFQGPIRRGYSVATLLQQALEKAIETDRKTLLTPKDKNITTDKDNDKVFLITTDHPHHAPVQSIIKKNWDILGKNSTTHFLYNKKLTCGFRRPKKLRDILTKAKVSPLPQLHKPLQNKSRRTRPNCSHEYSKYNFLHLKKNSQK